MRWLRIWLSVSCLALFGSTWKLWTPQTVFPQIPFLGALRTAPAWLDWIALAVMLVALVAMLAFALHDRSRPAAAGRDDAAKDERSRSDIPSPLTPLARGEGDRIRESRNRFVALLLVGSLTLLVLLDQHRFQPWAYQFGIVAIVLAFAPAGRAASLLRVLTVGIYFWSAVSKFDYTFLHGLGPELLRGLLSAFHLEPGWMRLEAATTLAWAFPLDELAVAILLAIRRTRTIGLVAAIAMHLLLLATLGPFGLNHSPGVLLWNVYFIGQDLLLFRRPAAGWRVTSGPGARRRFREILRGIRPESASLGIANAAVFAAVWLPILQPFGYLDYWPAWAVYAPSAERVTLLVNAKEANRLPERLGSFFVTPRMPSGFIDFDPRALQMDSWSLESVNVPIYPQGRFRVGVAIAIIERFQLEDATLIIEEPAERWSGTRLEDTYIGSRFVRDAWHPFRLNALPRSLGGW